MQSKYHHKTEKKYLKLDRKIRTEAWVTKCSNAPQYDPLGFPINKNLYHLPSEQSSCGIRNYKFLTYEGKEKFHIT